MTIIFLVVTVILRTSGGTEALEGFFYVGLIVTGASWVTLVLWDITGSPAALWLLPFLLFLIFLAPKLLKVFRRAAEDWQLKRRGDWRCPSCGKENEKIAPVCYYCQAWRKKSYQDERKIP
ncbi:MAG: hypothetical protein Q7J69_05765 [Candidatus Omnitrophota bacterium]|nr:hypothetical protein [Candidatus Omnitrophota bacterium]